MTGSAGMTFHFLKLNGIKAINSPIIKERIIASIPGLIWLVKFPSHLLAINTPVMPPIMSVKAIIMKMSGSTKKCKIRIQVLPLSPGN